jgi:hypothetical protein
LTAYGGVRPARASTTCFGGLALLLDHRLLAVEGRVRRQDNVLALQQRVREVGRLLLQHVERDPRQAARLERLQDRVQVHERSAGRVHQERVWTHHPQLGRADEVAGVLAQRGVHGHHVRSCQQRGQVDGLDAGRTDRVGLDVRICGEDPEPDRQGLLGQAPGDAPEPDQPERLATQAMQRAGDHQVPRARADRSVQSRDAATEREDQAQRVVGDLVDAVVRDVGDEDPLLGRRGDVDRARPILSRDDAAPA